jgi:hypothetical protein
VERINAAAARQGEKPYPLTQFPFKGTPVDILIWIYLLAKEDRNIEASAFLVHKSPLRPFVISKK